MGVKYCDELLDSIKRRKVAKYGHWRRRPDSFVCRVLDSRVPGNNRVGHRKTSWMDNVISWCGGVSEARNMAIERQRLARATAT